MQTIILYSINVEHFQGVFLHITRNLWSALSYLVLFPQSDSRSSLNFRGTCLMGQMSFLIVQQIPLCFLINFFSFSLRIPLSAPQPTSAGFVRSSIALQKEYELGLRSTVCMGILHGYWKGTVTFYTLILWSCFCPPFWKGPLFNLFLFTEIMILKGCLGPTKHVFFISGYFNSAVVGHVETWRATLSCSAKCLLLWACPLFCVDNTCSSGHWTNRKGCCMSGFWRINRAVK